METHGGEGKLWEACYEDLEAGVVFEKNPLKAARLGKQRPTWAVYEADCVAAIAGGAGAHLCVNLLDVDPYGEPWPVIDAFFQSERPRAETLWIVVNDGLRRKVQLGGAWACKSLAGIVSEYGNDLYKHFLDVAQILLTKKAAHFGYEVDRFSGYYCGHQMGMTHYAARLILRRTYGAQPQPQG